MCKTQFRGSCVVCTRRHVVLNKSNKRFECLSDSDVDLKSLTSEYAGSISRAIIVDFIFFLELRAIRSFRVVCVVLSRRGHQHVKRLHLLDRVAHRESWRAFVQTVCTSRVIAARHTPQRTMHQRNPQPSTCTSFRLERLSFRTRRLATRAM
jgi:hypothetical protein